MNTDIVLKEKTGLIFFYAEGICADRATFDIRKILNKSNNAKVVINENIGGIDGSACPFPVEVIPWVPGKRPKTGVVFEDDRARGIRYFYSRMIGTSVANNSATFRREVFKKIDPFILGI